MLAVDGGCYLEIVFFFLVVVVLAIVFKSRWQVLTSLVSFKIVVKDLQRMDGGRLKILHGDHR